MGTGLVFSILAGFTWSWVNVIDKVNVSRNIRRPFVLMTTGSLVALITGIFLVSLSSTQMVGWHWWLVLLSGVGYNIGNFFYFSALKREESSRIVPLFALVTVFVGVVGALFLGERFSSFQYAGIVAVIIGSWLLLVRRGVLDPLTSPALAQMLGAVGSYGVSIVASAHLLDSYSTWAVFGYHELAKGVFFLPLFFIARSQFREVLTKGKTKFLALAAGSELASIVGTGCFFAAIAAWYATLASAVVEARYIFLFGWTLLLTRYMPDQLFEQVSRRIVLQKFGSILLIIVGVILVSR